MSKKTTKELAQFTGGKLLQQRINSAIDEYMGEEYLTDMNTLDEFHTKAIYKMLTGNDHTGNDAEEAETSLFFHIEMAIDTRCYPISLGTKKERKHVPELKLLLPIGGQRNE